MTAIDHADLLLDDDRTPPTLPVTVAALLESAPADRAAVLRRRLERAMPMLRERLERVYGPGDATRAWTSRLACRAIEAALARSDELWTLDLAREADRRWNASGQLGYCAYVDKFAGTLAGVSRRIPHLRALGVTYLHLLPFLRAGAAPNDGGFAVASFEEIEPALGTMDDLERLARELRAAGIGLCSDFVLNHVSHDHPWARAAVAGDPHYRSFFHWMHSAEEVAAWERDLGEVFPKTAPGNFTRIEACRAWVWTTFYPYQWDLNYGQPAVLDEIVRALLGLANRGVEAFRLDSTGFLWKRAGTRCTNQPEVHALLQALRALVDVAAPGVLLKAEAIMPTRDLPPYFGLDGAPGAECHLAYHSSLMAAGWVALVERRAQLLADVLRATPPLPPGCAWVTYVRCHDDIGWNVLRPELEARGDDARERLVAASRFLAGQTEGSWARGRPFQADDPRAVHGTNGMAAALVGLDAARTDAQREAATERLMLLQSLSMFVGALPLIYMGDEMAMGNVDDAELAARAGCDGRELHRPWIDDAALARCTRPGTLEHAVHAGVAAMARARRAHAAFDAGVAVRVLDAPDGAVLALARGDAVLGLFNFGDDPVPVDALIARWCADGCVARVLLATCARSGATRGMPLAPRAAVWLSR